MYSIRESWIPAYYKDSPMSGLMKTTSRSESINAFFGVYAKYHSNLVFFIKKFDEAIDELSKDHHSLEVETRTTIPRMLSPSKIESHACAVYTQTIFIEVQKELNKANWFCGWEPNAFKEVGGNKIHEVSHLNKRSEEKAKYTVVHNIAEETFECSCNHFVRNGILCRHAFKIMLNAKVRCIPEKYILHQWRRELVPVESLPARARYGEMDVEKQEMMNKAASYFDDIIGLVRNDKDKLTRFVEQLGDMKDEISIDLPLESNTHCKNDVIQEYLGVTIPESVDILSPTGTRNKGCGTGKRLVGVSKKARNNAKKPRRMCRRCHQMARHDSRNCPTKGSEL